jgi:hypothetical protein
MLITGSPRSRRILASSFKANVGDSAIAFANLLMFINKSISLCKKVINDDKQA